MAELAGDRATWRREALRGTLWVVPTALVIIVGALFAGTYLVDQAVYRGAIELPSWVNSGSADAARQILTAIAAAVITVAGVVFSITIVALVLASTQFGPRIIRNFIRDVGTQVTLGVFVATFVFDVLTLGSITSGGVHGDFVPHLSITVALALLFIDLGVLIYFIHHVTRSIQLTQVVAGIARDLNRAIDRQFAGRSDDEPMTGPSIPELRTRLGDSGAEVLASASGYLQYVGYRRLVAIAVDTDSVVQMLHRPGHFVVEGRPLAVVWPGDRAETVASALARDHVVGPHRTLYQDLVFAIDQLVEIALRALSPAVNDTFTALTCIDWLGDGLCKISARPTPSGVHRDRTGNIRVIEAALSYERIVDGAYDKIRQAGRGMPAVTIRQLDNLTKILEFTTTPEHRDALRHQAEMLVRSSDAVPEEDDRGDVRSRYEHFIDILHHGITHRAPSGSAGDHERRTAAVRAPKVPSL